MMAGRIATELTIALRYRLRMLGVPVKGAALAYGDNLSVITSCSIPSSSLKKKWHAMQARIQLEKAKRAKLDKKLARGIDYEGEEAKGPFEIWNTEAGYFFGGTLAVFVVLIMLINDSK